LTSQSDDRLQYFTTEILPKYAKKEDHVCIFVSSYFDYCQLKQWFTSTAVYSFACLSEYEEGGAITGARSKFFNGHARFLLMTERFHFYRRVKLRGIKHLVWYGLPDHPEYFAEMAAVVGDIHKRDKEEEPTKKQAKGPKSESPIVFSQFDILKLERIVGTDYVEKLL
jgi:U3 small nucleolar RNA-associated protein 25